jgi:DASS family divalent anion:Na+ symporter
MATTHLPADAAPAAVAAPSVGPQSGTHWWRLLATFAVYVVVAHVFLPPPNVTPSGWRTTGVFLATIAGLMLQPLPGTVVVILGLTALVWVTELSLARVLAGFASPSVWLVLAAMLMSRALRDTGVARRIALLFVHRFGRTSLGISYALMFTDITLAAGIPSITARSGGIVLPIARSIAELYRSTPGAAAPLLGTSLMIALYQGSVVACAMFITGQASNVLAARLASDAAGVTMTATSWFVAGLVPGLASALAIPWVVHRMVPPIIRSTPAAPEFASRELVMMGPMDRRERIALAVFAIVAGLWLTSGVTGLDVTVVALSGLCILFVTGTLGWETALAERSAWDVYVWYGGLFTLGELLNETGSTQAFAQSVGTHLGDLSWFPALLLAVLIFFYAHYAFASITAHLLAMFSPFVIMLVGLGAPPGLVVYAIACTANLTAGLTHYGTTTGPIVYAAGYVTLRDWWRVGLVASIVNLAIWIGLGFVWWRVIGIW